MDALLGCVEYYVDIQEDVEACLDGKDLPRTCILLWEKLKSFGAAHVRHNVIA